MLKTIIVNLEKRKDRWEKVIQEVEIFGIKEYTRFNAIEGGRIGFNHSMYKCIQMSEMTLILEDDCYFEGTLKDLITCLGELPDNWDMLYLGATLRETAVKFSEHLCKINSAHTTHAILYSVKGAKYCFENFDPDSDWIYDDWLRNVAHKELNCFITRPMMAFQFQSHSDISNWDLPYDIKSTSKLME